MTMTDPNEFRKAVISDMRVELSEEFDKNFRRKAFFDRRWKPRQALKARGSLLLVTGALRRSIRAMETDSGVRFSSSMPYASAHNEGGVLRQHVRQHTRMVKGRDIPVKGHSRNVAMPQRQFIGDGPQTRKIVQGCIERALRQFDQEIRKMLKP